MVSGTTAPSGNQNTATRVLAGVLSPWAIIGVGVCILGILYHFYYKPRLFYSYSSYPQSPKIYFLPPFSRRRNFLKHPIEYLSNARRSLYTSGVFWTDVISGYDRKTVSIVSESSLIFQFLMIDDRDNLSWDAPLRSAWKPLFKSTSAFGQSGSFYNSSRYCLIHGFSLARTSAASVNSQILLAHTEEALANFVEGDLYGLVDSIVFKALFQIFFGPSVSTDLESTLRQVLMSISSKKWKVSDVKRLGNQFHDIMQDIIQTRSDDLEQNAEAGDYLQWLLRMRTTLDADTSIPKTPNTFLTGDNTDNHEQETSDSSTQDSQDASKQRRDTFPKEEISDHLLSTFIQTHLLATTCITWAVYSSATLGNNITPDPLLLVRQTRKEILLGSTIIPKFCYVAVSPVLERTKLNTGYINGSTESKREMSSTELSTLSAMNSVTDLNEHSLQDIYQASNHQSTGSFSPLLRSKRYSSNPSMNDLSEIGTRNNAESNFKSKKGSWIRRYPQGHLISLVVGSVSNSLTTNLAVTGSASIEPTYGSARTMWLPFPSSSISVLKAPSGKRPPTSLFNSSRNGSVSYLAKPNKMNGEVNVIDEGPE